MKPAGGGSRCFSAGCAEKALGTPYPNIAISWEEFRCLSGRANRFRPLLLDRGVRTSWFLRHLLRAGQLRTIPSAAQSLDQRNRGRHLLHLKIVECLLVGEQRVLRGQHVDVGIDARLIASLFQREIVCAEPPPAVLLFLCEMMRTAARESSTCWNAVSTV